MIQMKMRNRPIYFIDVETTGLSHNDKIIEFCIVRYHNGYATSIQSKVDPDGVPVHPQAQAVNGYSPEKWSDAITQEEAYEKIRLFTQDRGVWIGHNVKFDLGFLSRLYKDHGASLNARRTVDTYAIAFEHLVPMGLKSLGFDEIRRFLGWKVHKHHSAFQDAWDVFKFWRQISRMGILRRSYVRIKSLPYILGAV